MNTRKSEGTLAEEAAKIALSKNFNELITDSNGPKETVMSADLSRFLLVIITVMVQVVKISDGFCLGRE